MRWWIRCVCLLLSACALSAGPVEFGMAELNAAIDARNFRYRPKIVAELNIEAPETFRIEPYAAGGGHITGGDLRGLMYGLLEAAAQMRSNGRLKMTHGIPALALRGVRVAVHPDAAGLTPRWLAANELWQDYLMAMARARFNRLEVAFDTAPDPVFLPQLRYITQLAQQYGIEVAIGFGQPDTRAIAELLRECPIVRVVVLHGGPFSDPPGPADPGALLQTLHDSGRRVVLELPDSDSTAALIEAAGQSGAPLRLFSEYTGTSINPRPRDSYLDIDAGQGADLVNAISGAGFEVASPVDDSGRPALDAIAAWGRLGYMRPAP
jgi:hypothetical protein